MEFRKEKSEKSKELIRQTLKSDIFNISTGYYKTEKILPVSPKPNEPRQKKIEFIPKYKEEKHYERHFNNLLSDQQKHTSIVNLKPHHSHKNIELENIRNRSKELKKNCFDRNGNLSAKKLYYYDIFKKLDINNKNINNSKNKEYKHSNSKSLKENRTSSKKCLFNKNLLFQKNPIKLYNNNEKNSNQNNAYNYYLNNLDNNKYNNAQTLFINLFPYQKKENLNIINWTINPYNNYNYKTKNKSDLMNSDLKSPNEQKFQKVKSEKKYYGHPRELTKVFSTESNQLKRNNSIKKINKSKNYEQEYFNLLITNSNKGNFLLDEKQIKEIFYKNGLHAYDFNGDGMNGIFLDKKIKFKLRKNKNDENFDRNYRKVVKHLRKYQINIDKTEMADEKGFKIQNGVKKRKGTPGNALYKNIDKKDINTKLNTGFYLNGN